MRRAAGALILGALLLLGCRTPVPSLGALGPEDPRPAALLESLSAREIDLLGVRGTARVSLEGQRGSGFAKQLVLLERPASLRVEVLGLLNQRVAVLATDGETYDLYRAQNGAFESGAVRPSVLLEVAGLPLIPEEAVALLLGGPRTGADGWRVGGAALLPDGGVRIHLDEPAESVRRSFEFDGEGELRHYQVHAPGGELLLDVRYADRRAIAERSFAHRVDLDFPAMGARAQVEFKEIELNPELPEELFRLDF